MGEGVGERTGWREGVCDFVFWNGIDVFFLVYV